MSAKIIAMPDTGLAGSTADVARLLHALADGIDAGNWDNVRTVVCVIEYGDGQLDRQTCGGPIDLARVVGLLAMATHYAICHED